MGAEWQRFLVKIPKEFDEEQRETIADAIIEHIKFRTEQGIDKDGKPFAPYSKRYIESLDFKIAGKSAGDVNLTLSGDMLAELSLLRHKRGELMIGYKRGSEENARADGNIRGTYGQSQPNKRRARNFLGLKASERRALIKLLKDEDLI